MKIKTINGKAWVVCRDCGKIVRFDKPLFGSMHICASPKERKMYAKEIAQRARSAEQLIEDSAK